MNSPPGGQQVSHQFCCRVYSQQNEVSGSPIRAQTCKMSLFLP